MTDTNIILLLFVIKHFIADALLQTPYQYLNKGTFCHPGGIIHAAIHGLLTGLIALYVGVDILIIHSLILLDATIHYFIDYIKINIGKLYHWSEYKKDNINNIEYLTIYSNKFFILLILDQCLHFITYIILTYILIIE